MKLNRTRQLVLVSAASLLGAAFLAGCATLTVDFVYVTSAKAAGSNNYGEIDVFEVNSESGRMRQIPSSPFPSGGRNPVAEAVSADESTLYVVNEDDDTIVQFTIGNDGKVYPQHTTNTPGILPIALARSGSNLFVLDTYPPLPQCSSISPCSSSIAVFPLNTDNSLGTAVTNSSVSAQYWPLSLPSNTSHILKATSIYATGSYVFATAYDTTSSGGYVFAFTVSSTDGTLTAVNGGVPFAAGTEPWAMAADSTHLYVADYSGNSVLAYSIGSDGSLSAVTGSPFKSGSAPAALALDSTGKFAYVANSQDATVSAYTVSDGTLTLIGTYATGLQPVAIGIDPSMNQYVYTANFLGSNVSGFQLNATDGTLINSQFSPYTSNAEPTAVAAITHNGSKK